ncbi:5-oxoprolinase subunit PxpB [Calidifontibacter sp. DB0510]|uniref:5-oxoprolinase subunit PxpB n=1 Tax=Metallococcus carri TaxID=1656884 RepID=A0A967B055_9MICO|nr:5-oxoprolinase subunit PxpB [Metallococcus carri]NHN56339.1 5-oxoprolinase subunit PxpB [Metallococcus carri]NOP35963.1 5-oxoprolinase subunit PxpB [Calidifontibacter sp. DB2511S]
MRLLPCGDRAILVELDDADERRRFDAALRAAQLPGVVEQVPAATTVLVRLARGTALQPVADRLRRVFAEAPTTGSAGGDTAELTIEVVYDGADLDEVADTLGISREEVVRRHTGQLWTVEFGGFAPGFGYLIGSEGGLEVPRRDSPRTRIPAGSVGLAGEFSGVYPHASSGGWQLIGHTDLRLWDAERDPPALLRPGTRVTFVERDV